MDTVFISVTEQCPNRCLGYRSRSMMSYDNFKKIIRQLPKMKAIVLTGGEPLLHKDLVNMCRFASRNSVKPAILTSGAVLTDLKKLKPYVYSIVVTIKYPDSKDSDWKGNKKAFRNAISLLKSAYEIGMKAEINWAADRNNMIYLDEMHQLSQQYNAPINVLRFLPYSKSAVSSAFSDEEWEDFCTRVKLLDGVKIRFPSRESYMVCSGGVSRMMINTDGSVTPCLYWSFDSYANILEDGYAVCSDVMRSWREGWGLQKGCPCLVKLEV
jgi:MoaA/NifB/PqqE/SkfB family radical SAM enzyme